MTTPRSQHVRKIPLAVGAAAIFAMFASITGIALQSSPSYAEPAYIQSPLAHGSHDHHEQNEGDFKFGPAPAVFPPGAEMAVLQGDPSVAGAVFTVRLRLPNGYTIPPHWHPTDENVTVISGTFLVGLGDKFDKKTLLPPLKSGGFLTAPANVNHFGMAKGRTVVQVHAIGPFQLTYVNPADDPQKHS